jgi:anti-anti-sigma factor
MKSEKEAENLAPPIIDIGLAYKDVRGVTLVELTGKADIYNSKSPRHALLEIIDSGKKDLVIDLEGLDCIDSSGLAILIRVFEKTSLSGGSLRLACHKEAILEELVASGVKRVFPIYKSLEDCFDGKKRKQ